MRLRLCSVASPVRRRLKLPFIQRDTRYSDRLPVHVLFNHLFLIVLGLVQSIWLILKTKRLVQGSLQGFRTRLKLPFIQRDTRYSDRLPVHILFSIICFFFNRFRITLRFIINGGVKLNGGGGASRILKSC